MKTIERSAAVKTKGFMFAALAVVFLFIGVRAALANTTIGTGVTTTAGGTLVIAGHSALGGVALDEFPLGAGTRGVLLNVGNTITNLSADQIGVAAELVLNPGAAASNANIGINGRAAVAAGNTRDLSGASLTGLSGRGIYGGTATGMSNFQVIGLSTDATNDSSGTVNFAIGASSTVYNNGSGAIGIAAGLLTGVENDGSGTITTAGGVVIQSPTNNSGGGGTIGTNYGLRIDDQSGVAGIGTSYNLLSTGNGSMNVFEGNVGIGADPPTQKLDVNGRVRVRDNAKGTCDATAAGGVAYEVVANVGHFWGCRQTGAGTFAWTQLDN